MKKVILLLLFCNANFIYAEIWNVLWIDLASTNYFKINEINQNRNQFLLLSIANIFGVRFIEANLENNLDLLIDIYIKNEFIYDYLYAKSFHDNLYNNNFKMGSGIKAGIRNTSDNYFAGYLYFGAFCELKCLLSFIPSVINQLEDIYLLDFIGGVQFQIESKRDFLFQYKFPIKILYCTTNFSPDLESPYLFAILCPELVFNFITIWDIYLRLEYIKDLFVFGGWNRNPNDNNLKSIIGMRLIFRLRDFLNLTPNELFYSLNLLAYSEFEMFSLLKDTTILPDMSDFNISKFKLGLQLSWDLGSAY